MDAKAQETVLWSIRTQHQWTDGRSEIRLLRLWFHFQYFFSIFFAMFSVVCAPRRGRWTSDTLRTPNSMQINARAKIHCDAGEVEPGAASPHHNANVCEKRKTNLKLEQYFLQKEFFLHGSTQTLPVRRVIQGRTSSVFSAQDRVTAAGWGFTFLHQTCSKVTF